MLIPLGYMKKRLSARAASLSLLLTFVVPRDSYTLTINANLTDLVDAVVGQDLWNASFSLSSGTFQANHGFTIFFDPALYKDLSAPLLPLPPGWDTLTIQPDPLLSAPGFLDGLALVNNPTLLQPFRLNFTWLGANQPGSQRFETYSQIGTFQITETGQTIVGVPEPGTLCWALGLFGVLSVPARRRPMRA